METVNSRMSICNNNLVEHIQNAFVLLYPYLKIEFFKIEAGAVTIRSIKIEPNTTLRALSNIQGDQKIDIGNNRTVAEVSHDFEHLLGTIVKVSRKSGNVWVAISVTEGWTLENQNTAGRNISNEMATL